MQDVKHHWEQLRLFLTQTLHTETFENLRAHQPPSPDRAMQLLIFSVTRPSPM